MYEDYWQLETKPFEPTFDARFAVPIAAQQAALQKLRYAVESRRPAALLSGATGIGKTQLVQQLREAVADTSGLFLEFSFPLMSHRDLLVYLAERLGAPQAERPQHTMEESLRRIEHKLRKNFESGKHAVLVVDEAHLLEDAGLLEPLRLLMNCRTEGQPLFTLLLVGQLSLLAIMERNGNLDERIELKTVLKPLTLEESAEYIQHRLAAAGATREIFTEDAILAAHQLAGGIPRRLNRLGDLALVVGFAAGDHSINAEQLRAVDEELLTLRAA